MPATYPENCWCIRGHLTKAHGHLWESLKNLRRECPAGKECKPSRATRIEADGGLQDFLLCDWHFAQILPLTDSPELARISDSVRNIRQRFVVTNIPFRNEMPVSGDIIKTLEGLQQETEQVIEKLDKIAEYEQEQVPCPTCRVDLNLPETGLSATFGEAKAYKREEPLNPNKPKHRSSERMVTYTEVLGIDGGEFIAKGIERGLVELDKYMGKEAEPPHWRPSTWINLLWGVGAQVGALWARVSAPWDLILVAEGAHHLTKLVDYLEEYVGAPPVAGIRVEYRKTGPTTPPAAGVGPSYSRVPYSGR